MSSYKYEFTAEDVIQKGRVRKEDVMELREWLVESKLPPIPDELIVLFLIACCNNLINTKRAINAHFKYNNTPELFDDRDIDSPELQLAIKTMKMASLPRRTDDDAVVHFFRIDDPNYRNFNQNDILKLAFMLIDISHQNKNPPTSLKVVIDMGKTGFMHLTRIRIGTLYTFIQYLQDAMPLHMTEVHIINSMYILDRVLALIKPFMKPELYNLLRIHPKKTDMEMFFKEHIPAKCMPKDYGGELPSCQELIEKTIERLRELKPFFESEEAFRKSHPVEHH